jgi:hypothetical protein
VLGGIVIWIHLAEERVLWQAWVNTIMELMIERKGGEILEELSDSYVLEKSDTLFILQNMYKHTVSFIYLVTLHVWTLKYRKSLDV